MFDRTRTPIVVIGVSGCGKTTVAPRLAEKTGRDYLDADGLRPSPTLPVRAPERPRPTMTEGHGSTWSAAGLPTPTAP